MQIINKLKIIKSAVMYGGYNNVIVNQIMDSERLKGRTVLITGGSNGIGFQIAKRCIESGAKVVITGRDENKLIKAKSELKDDVEYLVWDICDINSIEEKLDKAKELLGGKIDCLVNNAGVQPKRFFLNVNESEWDSVYNTNSKGVFFLTQEICKRWIEDSSIQYYRKIINIDSQGGFVGATYPYRMTKWDIRGLTQGLGIAMARHGVLVNGIAPGVIKTEMQEFAIKQGDNCFCNQNLLSRVALPEEVAELAIFILSDSCNFLVGQTIVLDGGYSIK